MSGKDRKINQRTRNRVLKIDYDGEVLNQFFWDKSEVCCIQGPVGSGKTNVALLKLGRMAGEQVMINGKRKSRWIITRPTTPELKSTTIKDFLDMYPEGEWGRISYTPPITYYMKAGSIEAEFIFLALDDDADLQKLKSTNITGAYVNEGQNTDLKTVTALLERAGRYPKPEMVRGKLVRGSIKKNVQIDMNAADESHWVPIMRGDVPIPEYFTTDQIRMHKKPSQWAFYVQPPALLEVMDSAGMVVDYKLNPKAENLKFLPEDYYESKTRGQSKDVIDMTCMNRTGSLRGGKPVFVGWNKEIHVARDKLVYKPELPLLVGLDYGRTPAAVWGQVYGGRWFILGEYYMEDTSSDLFAPALKRELARRMPDIDWSNIQWWGDPAGDFKGQADEKTSVQVFRKHGIVVRSQLAALRFAPRKAAIDAILARMVNGFSGLLVDASCTMLVSGFGGGYQWRKVRTGQGDSYLEEPVKNKYSHPMDALMYLFAGGGEITDIVTGGVKRGNVDTRVNTRVFRSDREKVFRRV